MGSSGQGGQAAPPCPPWVSSPAARMSTRPVCPPPDGGSTRAESMATLHPPAGGDVACALPGRFPWGFSTENVQGCENDSHRPG
jgi:hypothetical protein